MAVGKPTPTVMKGTNDKDEKPTLTISGKTDKKGEKPKATATGETDREKPDSVKKDPENQSDGKGNHPNTLEIRYGEALTGEVVKAGEM